ncbi:MAG: DsbA family oxidoreductase [Bacteroidia bacterium]|nr:DsbA family oxidoreductase [Bacteroidia bacterium]
MKVEIWSDVMCPFCYIGKRKFELALQAFDQPDKIEIEWKSFQLNPNLISQPDSISIHQYLAEAKGWPLEKAIQLNQQVAEMGKEVGLDFHFELVKVTNTLLAHRFLQLAKSHEIGNQAKAELFRAHFVEGKAVDQEETLLEIGKTIGLPEDSIRLLFHSDSYLDEVRKDLYEAQQLGIRGVPFFVFDHKFAVSGAQSPEIFIQALKKMKAEASIA